MRVEVLILVEMAELNVYILFALAVIYERPNNAASPYVKNSNSIGINDHNEKLNKFTSGMEQIIRRHPLLRDTIKSHHPDIPMGGSAIKMDEERDNVALRNDEVEFSAEDNSVDNSFHGEDDLSISDDREDETENIGNIITSYKEKEKEEEEEREEEKEEKEKEEEDEEEEEKEEIINERIPDYMMKLQKSLTQKFVNHQFKENDINEMERREGNIIRSYFDRGVLYF